MYYAVGRDIALSASFVLECFDGSEVTTREGNELVVQKENCVVEEIKEVELRSHKPSVSTLTRSVSILHKPSVSILHKPFVSILHKPCVGSLTQGLCKSRYTRLV